jgi:hypothetical protein
MSNDTNIDKERAKISLRQQGAGDYRLSATVALSNKVLGEWQD